MNGNIERPLVSSVLFRCCSVAQKSTCATSLLRPAIAAASQGAICLVKALAATFRCRSAVWRCGVHPAILKNLLTRGVLRERNPGTLAGVHRRPHIHDIASTRLARSHWFEAMNAALQ
jgi:hypothetical protein